MNYKAFQREDIARITCTDGAILGWEQGLGKTIALFTIPLIKVGFHGRLVPNAPVLLVAPANLIDQLITEGRKLFGISISRIDSRAHFLGMSRPLAPGWYITSFTALAINGDTPKLHHLLRDQFEAVVIDEGTRIQKDDSLTSEAVCSLRPKYRFLMTGTPIKNRIRSIFRLAWWVAGAHSEPTARFPYGPDEGKRFAAEFSVVQKSTRGNKVTAETCNLSLAWKILAPLVLRRRKDDAGERIVQKIHKTIRVPLGAAQAASYGAVLKNPPLDARGFPAFMASLSKLRATASVVPGSAWILTPKIHSTLQLLRNLIAEGEQVLVFSSFHLILDALSNRLKGAGVPVHIADGRAGPDGCASLAARFKAKEFPILLCGEAMTDGHSFPEVAHVVRLDRPWAHDKAAQAPDRAHRLNSTRDVTIWDMVAAGTIDVVIDSLLADKERTADLVLDARLQSKNSEEMTPAKLFRAAECVWESGETIAEASLEAEWPALAEKLRQSGGPRLIADWRKRLNKH